MKRISLIGILVCMALQSCGQSSAQEQQATEQENMDLIASTKGYELTEADFEIYLNYVQEQTGVTADIASQILIKSQLKETFLKEPEKLLQQLQLLNRADAIETPESQNPIAITTTVNRATASLAEGHRVVRQKLGNDIGQMQFDTDAANTFRSYVTNSLITSSSNSSNSAYNSSDHISSKNQFLFCSNGTYTETNSGHVSLDVEGLGAHSAGTTYVPGYWDVAALPNGMMIIVMYSNHPEVLEDWPNGIIPFIIAKHGVDFVALPSGDLLGRTANQYCN